MNCIRNSLSLLFLCCSLVNGFSQQSITGQIFLDSSWNKLVYLSEIADFSKISKMSEKMIIDVDTIGPDGIYSFSVDYLPIEYHLYRIHFTQSGDPPATFTTGGKNENHFYLIANKFSSVEAYSGSGRNLLNNLKIFGDERNEKLNQANRLIDSLESTNMFLDVVNREFARKSALESLKLFADSCNFPLVALHVLYHFDFEVDYKTNPKFYKQFLKKWSKQNSAYFNEFRTHFPRPVKTIFILMISILFIFILALFYMKSKRTVANNPEDNLNKLTVQERRILKLLTNGKTNQEIANDLSISLSTVKAHIYNIYSKLEVNSRKELLNSLELMKR